MKKDTITVSMDAEKLRATKRYMEKKDANIESELCDQIQKLYEKYVPLSVREYIESVEEDAAPTTHQNKKQKEKTKSVAGMPSLEVQSSEQ